MKITKTLEGNTATLLLEGWLDTTTAPELEAVLAALEPEVTALILDFAGVEYISSAGLRLLVVAYKQMKNGSLKLVHVSKSVMEVFKMTGFDTKLDIQE